MKGKILSTAVAFFRDERVKVCSVYSLFCQMDSMSMFFNEYPSSDSTVTGIVTLLATAKALWNLQETIESQAGAKDIMFTFLQGVIPRQLSFIRMYCRCCWVGWV